MMTKRDSAISAAAREHSSNRDSRTSFICGARWADEHPRKGLVDIASMADEYYDALIKEAEMNVDMAGHCRLAYYSGCKDVLNKTQKGE